MAKRTATARSVPRAISAARAPTKASPAPCADPRATVGGAMASTADPSQITTPAPPSVTMATRGPRRARAQCRFRCIEVFRHRSDDLRGLDPVHNEEFNPGHEIRRDGACGRGVQDDPRTGGGAGHRQVDRLRNLVLHQDHRRAAGIDLCRVDAAVHTGHDHCAIIALRVDDRHAHPRGALHLAHLCAVHPRPVERIQNRRRKPIRADPPRHGDRCAHPRRRQRLIAALAAEAIGDARAHQRLVQRRQTRRVHHHVKVQRTDDEDVRHVPPPYSARATIRWLCVAS